MNDYLQELFNSPVVIELATFVLGCMLIFTVLSYKSILRWLLCPKEDTTATPCEQPTEPCPTKFDFFGYSCEPPDGWLDKFPNATGQNQSPINIKCPSVLLITPGTRRVLTFSNEYFVQPQSMTVLNDGFCVTIGTCFTEKTPMLSGGPLRDQYRFNMVQFRWGPTADEGSEHTLNSRRYAMEMQLMHIRGERVYPDLDSAARDHSVAFISVLFDITLQDNPFLMPLISSLSLIREPHSAHAIDPFPLCWLFQPFKSKYYYYQGSITCPPCTEGVEWIVQAEPLCISHRQLQEFRTLMAVDGPMYSNSRPVQNINNRSIQYYL